MQYRSQKQIRYSFALLDIIFLNISYGITMALLNTVNPSAPYMVLSASINVCWIISSYSTALYISKQNNYAYFFKRSIQTFFVFLFLILFFHFFYHYSFSRLFVILSFLIFFVFIVLSRIILLGALYFSHQLSIEKNIVIVGCNEVSQRLLDHLKTDKEKIKIHGCFKEDDHYSIKGTNILGNLSTVMGYSITNDVNEIYSTISPEKNNLIYEIAEEAEKNFIRFKYVPDFRLFVNRRMHVELQKDIPILSLRPDPLEDRGNRFKKRLFDISFSWLVILLVLWWLIPIIALLIKLESKGPIIFKQLRSGKNNIPFYCYKFRSLIVNNDSHEKQVIKNDCRFTRVGKLLRKTNLDELPQFLNVLQNTMSIIGPRPHMIEHTMEWAKLSSQYMLRHYIKPGITGWAQVNGYRGEIKEENMLLKRIEHDIWYMEHWSMWLDIRIILLSIFKTISGDKKAI